MTLRGLVLSLAFLALATPAVGAPAPSDGPIRVIRPNRAPPLVSARPEAEPAQIPRPTPAPPSQASPDNAGSDLGLRDTAVPSEEQESEAPPTSATAERPSEAPPKPPADSVPMVDFASTTAMLSLGDALSENPVNDAANPNTAWYTLGIKNDGVGPIARVLVADDPPSAGLAFLPQTGRPTLREAAGSDSGVVIERAGAFGRYVFRVTLPPAHSAVLALHFESVAGRPALLAWTEAALVSHNRRAAILSGVVGGLLAAAAAFALGAAMLSGRTFDKWVGAFLSALMFTNLVGAGVLDESWFTTLGGPYGLLALGLSLTVATGARLIDHVVPFATFHPLGRWRDLALVGVVLLGVGAAVGIPLTGLLVRLVTVAGAGAAAGYLAHFGRLGLAGPRYLAPAATVFALVTAAATFHAVGLLPPNLVAPAAIGGFATAGAMLVALSCVLPNWSPARTIDQQPSASPEGLSQERDALVASHQGVFDLNLRSGHLTLSPGSAIILGLPPGAGEMEREAWRRRIHPDDRATYDEALKAYASEPGSAFRLKFRARGADDKVHWFELRATMGGAESEADRCLGLIADVTARKQSEADNAKAVRVDPMTGLGNRIALVDRLEYAADLSRVTLAVFDIDRFKAVNASLGQEAADHVLREMARRLAKHLDRHADIFRVGGVTFAVLAERPVGDPKVWAEGIVHRLAEAFSLEGREVFLTASVGVATGPMADNAMDLLNVAELAMVQSKREGGARVVIYSQELADAIEEDADPVALEADLRRAMERGEMEIHYQPIIRLSDDSVAGFEALLRWKHPERGNVAPEVFVGHSEETGLIRPLGRLALKKAAEDVTRWQHFFPLDPPIFVSVNVSWRQISDESFLRDLESVLRATALPMGTLKLEMTESAVMADVDVAEKVLKRLHAMGIGLALDDFGTGHSSLAQLKRFPFDVIKVDRSFLAPTDASGDTKILSSIVALAHELGLDVVAEGVEDERDARRLRDLGCEYAQGYFFGAPLPASEVTSYIAMTYARTDLSAAGSGD